jgi:3-methylcrotonyl-CoA carboxylase beta subunit
VLKSRIDPRGDEARANTTAMRALVADLRRRTAELTQRGAGGDERSVARHRQRGKLPVRERIDRLLDPGAPFLELTPLAANGLYDDDAPGAGVVTGIGRVSGVECVIVANDATVKGGTYYPMTVKKHLRAQEIALANRLPCIYLVDSGGAFLPLQDDVFPDRDHFGRIFYNQAQMSAKGIPQVALVMGSCTAGGAYVPAMSDETVIVRGTGTIFLGGPPLVKAATGEDVTAEELGGAAVHARISGVADHEALDDEHALALGRQIVDALAWRKPEPPWTRREPVEPAVITPSDAAPDEWDAEGSADPTGLYGVVSADNRRGYDVREVIARLVDGSEFHEFKPGLRRDARHRVRASRWLPHRHPRQQRRAVQSVGRSRGRTSSSWRASGRCRWCSSRTSPGSWSVASTRRAASPRTGRNWSPRSHAPRCRSSRSSSAARSVPGNYGMAGRAYGSRGLWMWPNARISVMGGTQAARVLSTVRAASLPGGEWPSVEERDAFEAPILAEYERQGNPYYSTARLWGRRRDRPRADARRPRARHQRRLNAPIPETRFGVFRM